MFGEQFLAGIGFEVSKALAGIRQHEIAFTQLGEPQQLKRFTEMEDLVGFLECPRLPALGLPSSQGVRCDAAPTRARDDDGDG